MRRIPGPANSIEAPRIGKQLVADGDLLSLGYVEQHGLVVRDPIARLEVVVRLELRLELVLRRRLDEVDLPILALFGAKSDEVTRIGRPVKIRPIEELLRSILR